jgi:hypothetical protein
MIMGFGKSSIVVPALVGHYLDLSHVRLVFVTQPERLVLDATRVVGALVASHPYVRDMPLYLLSKGDAVSIGTMLASGLVNLPFKAVVVLSTADMQQIVRDNPVVYEADRAGSIVHIADEVDAESNPLTCEVIIAGSETAAHYNRAIAEQPGAYYRAAFDLVGKGPSDPGVIAQLGALDAMQELDPAQPMPGKRLLAVYNETLGMQHRVSYGLSDDPDEYIAVPFSHSDVPMRGTFYTDLDASTVLLARAVLLGMRASDRARVLLDVRAAFRSHAHFIEALLLREDRAREYFATVMAMPRIRISKTELSVAFVDLIGAAGTLVGFSGTLGVEIAVPTYQIDDPRFELATERPSIEVVPDSDGQAKVLHDLGRFPCIVVEGAFGAPRAERVLTAIKEHASFLDAAMRVCVVDGCGEFGAFDSHVQSVATALGDVGYWDSSGKPQNQRARVRYYCHRDSRGVDSKMPIKTVGFIVVSLNRTTVVDAAQALYRLRWIEDGQTAVFVVVSDSAEEHASHGGHMSHMSVVVPHLEANEKAWNEAGRAVQLRHVAHAAIPKRSTEDFERVVTYTDVVDSTHKIAHKTEHKKETKFEKIMASHTRGAALVQCYMSSEPLGAQRTIHNESVTAIKPSLDALGIGFSPVLERTPVRPESGDSALRRVFAIRVDDAEAVDADRRASHAPHELVVMTVVEIWGVHAQEAAQRARYSVHAHDGHRIPTWREPTAPTAPTTALALFGRLLCGDSLAITEEIELLEFMRARYKDLDGSLLLVMSCLYKTGFLSPSKSKYMGALAASSVEDVLLRIGSSEPITIIDELVQRLRTPTASMFGATRTPLRRLFV